MALRVEQFFPTKSLVLFLPSQIGTQWLENPGQYLYFTSREWLVIFLQCPDAVTGFFEGGDAARAAAFAPLGMLKAKTSLHPQHSGITSHLAIELIGPALALAIAG